MTAEARQQAPTQLAWIRDALDTLFDSGRQALEDHAGAPAAGESDHRDGDRSGHLARAAEAFLQLAGTLRMLEIDSAAQVVEEMHALTLDLASGALSDEDHQRLSVLLGAGIVVHDYLDRLQASQGDVPLVLLPVLNELRAARGKPLITEGDLFNPRLAGEMPELPPHDQDTLPDGDMNRLRSCFQGALRDALRAGSGTAELPPLLGACIALAAAADNESARRLWRIAALVVYGLIAGMIDRGVAVQRVLVRLDILLKRGIDKPSGTAPEDLTEEDRLARSLLFHIAIARRGDPVLDRTAEQFGLAGLLPDSLALSGAMGSVRGRNRALFDSVAKAVLDELAAVKDALDLQQRTGTLERSALAPLASVLTQAAGTLEMIGLSEAAREVQAEVERLDDIQQQQGDIDESLLLDIATSLLDVEEKIKLAAATMGGVRPGGMGALGADRHRHELDQVVASLLGHTLENIHLAQQQVENLVASGHGDGAAIARLLNDADGALTMLNMQLAHRVLAPAGRFFTAEVSGSAQPDAERLARFADALAALEIHLTSLHDRQGERPELLEKAIADLAALGYTWSAEDDLAPDAGSAVAAPAAGALPAVETAAAGPADDSDAGAQSEAAEPEDIAAVMEAAAAPPPEHEAPQVGQPQIVTTEPKIATQEVPGEAAEVTAGTEPAAAPVTIDAEFLEIFIEEMDAEIAALRDQLSRFDHFDDPLTPFREIRRSFHTIKGSGRMVGAEEIGEFAWAIENMMNQVIEGRLPVAAVLPTVEDAIDLLPALRARLRGSEAETHSAERLTELKQRAAELAAGAATAAAITPPAEEPEPAAEPPAEALPAAAPPDTEPLPAIDPMLAKLIIGELGEHHKTVAGYVARCTAQGWTEIPGDDLIRAIHTLAGNLGLAEWSEDTEALHIVERYLRELEATQRVPDEAGLQLLAGVAALAAARLALLHGEPPVSEIAPQAVGNTAQALLDRFYHQLPGTQAATPPEEPETTSETVAEPATEAGVEVEVESEPETKPESEAQTETATGTQAEQIEWYIEPVGEAEIPGHSAPADEPPATDRDTAAPAFADVIPLDYSLLDEDLLDIFLSEADDLLEALDASLLALRHDAAGEHLDPIRRHLHTLKGGARVAGLEAIGELGHWLETLIEQTPGEALSAGGLDTLQTGCDHLHAMIQAAQRRQPLPASALLASRPATAPEPAPRPAPAAAAAQPQPAAAVEAVRVDARLLDTLVNYAGEISIFRSRLEQETGNIRQNIVDVQETVQRLRDQLRKLELETEAQILSRYQREAEQGETHFDPLELDRYSTIQQLSRALAESVNDLISLQEALDAATGHTETLLLQQSRVNRELQEGLMQTRLVPFASLAPRLRRVVRRACNESGKSARLDLHLAGGESDVDRNVLNRITAPLEHMMRNAIVHGIETPAERAARGKPLEGVIRIAVEREATELLIQVSDDGAGLDRERIAERGRAMGLIPHGQHLAEHEVLQLIFTPGFSTAGELTTLAGRGVGMDVVGNEVRQLGGSIEIDTAAGRGTTFKIRIPLTLAVMQAIIVQAAERAYAIPLSGVRGVMKMSPRDYLQAIDSSQPVCEYVGTQYPILELESQLGLPLLPPPDQPVPLLMIEAGGSRAALRVAHLESHREIVVKPIGPQVSSITGILSGTITPDGQVMLILDMGPLIRRGLSEMRLPGVGATLASEHAEPAVAHQPLVLVVDDSITMRKVTARVLENRKLEVLTARDGLDAVELMYERIPDLILLDIEMPRMDGYELAAHVRNDPRLRHVPMMIISSRTGEKHRQKGAEVGVDRYLGKPYREAELIDNVFELLAIDGPKTGG